MENLISLPSGYLLNLNKKNMKKELKEKVKKAIENFEFNNNGLRWTMGGYVDVKKITEDEDYYYANVTIGNDADGTRTTYDNCEYPKKEFKIK